MSLWVSTRYLQQKYNHLNPTLILPKPVAAPQPLIKVFYHGSASHSDEIEWLYPVIKEVLAANEQICFEIIGNTRVNNLYRKLVRTSIIHPLKWPSYQALLATPGRHIGLVPQLNTPFNRARSYTKFFDITRAGAAGIYALNSECTKVVTDGIEGIIQPMDPNAWIEAIISLANQPNLRKNLCDAAHKKCLTLMQ